MPSPRKQSRDRWLRQRPDPRGTGRSDRLERTLVHVHVVILVGFVAATAAPLLWSGGSGPVEAATRVVLAVTFAGVAVDLLRRGERLGHLAVLGVGLGLAVVLEAAHRPGDVGPMLAFSAVAVSGARLLRLVPFALTLLVVGTAFSLALGLNHDDSSMMAQVDGVLLGAALAVSIAGFVGSLEEGTRVAEQLDEEALARERALHHEQSRRGAVAAAGRVLHDEVLTSLRLVADGSQHDLDPDVVRDSCRTSARAVRDETTPGRDGAQPRGAQAGSADRIPVATTLGEQLDEVAARSGVAAVLEGPPRARGVRLPPAVADAVARAVAEALRNVARHSGTYDAVVRLAVPGPVVAVEVVDRGRGLPPGSEEGFGLGQSVRGAMAEVGGAATVEQTPGGGTTVRLTVPRPRRDERARVRRWSRADLARSHRQTMSTSGGSIALVRAVAWPQGLAWTYLALRYSWGSPQPSVMLGLLVLLVGVTIVVAHRLERRPPTPARLGVLVVVLVGAQALGLAALPPAGMLDYRSWTVGFIAVPVMTVCFFLPRGLGLLVVAPHPLVVLAAARLEPALTMGLPPLGSLNATMLTPVLGVVLGGLLRRAGREVEAERERLSQAERALARRRAMAEVADVHLEHTRDVVVPWLEEVATAQVDLGDPTTADTARTLSREVRDDLYAPGFFDPLLRRLVTEARRRGATVEVGAGFAPGAADRTTGLLLRELAPRLRPGTKLTVATADGRARLSLVPGDPDLVRRVRALAPTGLSVDVDDFRAVLRYDDAPPIRGLSSDQRTG